MARFRHRTRSREQALPARLDTRMDALTQEIYSAEFAKGKLFDRYGGKPVRVARDEVAALMTDQYGSVVMYEFDTRPVVCRCGNRVKVKILHDQWFLKYSDPAWKKQVSDQPAGYGARSPERSGLSLTGQWTGSRTGHAPAVSGWAHGSPGTRPSSSNPSPIRPSTWRITPSPTGSKQWTPTFLHRKSLSIYSSEKSPPTCHKERDWMPCERSSCTGTVQLPVLGKGPYLKPPHLPDLPPCHDLPQGEAAQRDGRLWHGAVERCQDVLFQGQCLFARGRGRGIRRRYGADVPDGERRAMAGL